jgi:hypothetical protein
VLEAGETTGGRGIAKRRVAKLEGREAITRAWRDVKRSVGEINRAVRKRGTGTGGIVEEERGGGKEERGGVLIKEEELRGRNGDGGMRQRAVDVEGGVAAAGGGGEWEVENWRAKWRAG